MRLFIPFTKIHCKHQPSWFTVNIRHHIKCLRTLRRRHKRHPTRSLEEKSNYLKSHSRKKLPIVILTMSYTSSESIHHTTTATIFLSISGISPIHLFYTWMMILLNLTLILLACSIPIFIQFSQTHLNYPMLITFWSLLIT